MSYKSNNILGDQKYKKKFKKLKKVDESLNNLIVSLKGFSIVRKDYVLFQILNSLQDHVLELQNLLPWQ